MTIAEWIEQDGTFLDGLALYRQAGGTHRLSELERIVEKRFLSQADKDLLRNLLTQLMPPSQVSGIAISNRHTDAAEPAQVEDLRQRGRKLKKRESFVHAQMVIEAEQGADQEKLYLLAEEMMQDIHPQLDQVYDALREYEQKGILPPNNKQEIIQETVEMMKKRDSIRTRIYRLRGMLEKEKLDQLDRQKYEAELAEKEQELAQLNRVLGL